MLNKIKILILCLKTVQCILNGDTVQWDRHGFLTKVLSRKTEELISQVCVGSLISPSLVITSPECVKNNTSFQKLDEIVVSISHINEENGLKEKFYSSELLEITNEYALLKIKSLNISELCPPNPAPKRITRLPIVPSLVNPSALNLNSKFFREYNCYIVSFETTINNSFIDFEKNQQYAVQLNLEKLHDPIDLNNLYRSRIVPNNTACFDDTGAPLICHIMPQNYNVQLGMFRFLRVPENTIIDKKNLEVCKKANEMEFSMLVNDQNLLDAIQRYDFSEFIAAYKKCNFMD